MIKAEWTNKDSLDLQPTTDTISRQAAIDKIDSLYRDTAKNESYMITGYNHAVSDALAITKSLPSAQPEPRWIPCSERLPKCGRQVLVYARNVHFVLAKYDEMRNADGIYEMKWVTFDAWKPFYTIKEVIAWMSLPEPYEDSEE